MQYEYNKYTPVYTCSIGSRSTHNNYDGRGVVFDTGESLTAHFEQ